MHHVLQFRLLEIVILVSEAEILWDMLPVLCNANSTLGMNPTLTI